MSGKRPPPSLPTKPLESEPTDMMSLMLAKRREMMKPTKNPVKIIDDDDVWDYYHVCYHGTSPDFIKDIIETRSLLLPGDFTKDGLELKIIEGHIKSKGKRYNEYTKKYEEFDPIHHLLLLIVDALFMPNQKNIKE